MIKKTIVLFYKSVRKIFEMIVPFFYNNISKLLLYINGVTFGKNISVLGFLKVYVTRRGNFIIGDNCAFNGGDNNNLIGRQQRMIFWVEGNLSIGNNVGMSSTAIICKHEIQIGNNVKIGGNTVIYDTDFHSLNHNYRLNTILDFSNTKFGKVIIGNNVFIGAHSTILKGVTIGDRSIVGACSVVTKNIPEDEIWAGNPAKFISKIIQ